MIAAAVAHQLRRPTLARLVDLEEDRLPVGADAEPLKARISTLIGHLLAAPDLSQEPHDALVSEDLLAIVKGMVDAAGQRGEIDAPALRRRVERAVFGYLASDGSAAAD